MVHCFFAVSNVDWFSCSFLWFMFTRPTFLRRYLLVTVFPQRVLSPSNLIWFFFSTFLFSLNNRSPSSGGDDPGIKQIKLFVLFFRGRRSASKQWCPTLSNGSYGRAVYQDHAHAIQRPIAIRPSWKDETFIDHGTLKFIWILYIFWE